MGVVHEADLDVLRALDRGERRFDWDVWFGHPDGADYLTDEGKRVVRRAVADLTDFFGPTWLDEAVNPDRSDAGPRIQGLGAMAPVLALTRLAGRERMLSPSAGGHACSSWWRIASRDSGRSGATPGVM